MTRSPSSARVLAFGAVVLASCGASSARVDALRPRYGSCASLAAERSSEKTPGADRALVDCLLHDHRLAEAKTIADGWTGASAEGEKAYVYARAMLEEHPADRAAVFDALSPYARTKGAAAVRLEVAPFDVLRKEPRFAELYTMTLARELEDHAPPHAAFVVARIKGAGLLPVDVALAGSELAQGRPAAWEGAVSAAKVVKVGDTQRLALLVTPIDVRSKQKVLERGGGSVALAEEEVFLPRSDGAGFIALFGTLDEGLAAEKFVTVVGVVAGSVERAAVAEESSLAGPLGSGAPLLLTYGAYRREPQTTRRSATVYQ